MLSSQSQLFQYHLAISPCLLHNKLSPHYQNNPISIQTSINFFHLNKKLSSPYVLLCLLPQISAPQTEKAPQQSRTFSSHTWGWRAPHVLQTSVQIRFLNEAFPDHRLVNCCLFLGTLYLFPKLIFAVAP